MKAGASFEPLCRRWISSSEECQMCNLHDRSSASCTCNSAIRPPTESEAHVYFGRLTTIQTATDHVGVAACGAVRAGQRLIPGKWTPVGGLPWNGHRRSGTRRTAQLRGAERHEEVAMDCRIRDSTHAGRCCPDQGVRVSLPSGSCADMRVRRPSVPSRHAGSLVTALRAEAAPRSRSPWRW
jgi:hypothetical protein